MLTISLAFMFIAAGSLVATAGTFYVVGTIAKEARDLQILEDRVRKMYEEK
jgi:hypothetical protein